MLTGIGDEKSEAGSQGPLACETLKASDRLTPWETCYQRATLRRTQLSEVVLSSRGHRPRAPIRIVSGHVLLFAECAPACLGSGGQCSFWLDRKSGAQGCLSCVSIHNNLPLSLEYVNSLILDLFCFCFFITLGSCGRLELSHHAPGSSPPLSACALSLHVAPQNHCFLVSWQET